MARNNFLGGSHRLMNAFDVRKYNRDFRAEHPDYFDSEGVLVFCGPQGSGKTLSAVQYCRKVLEAYPKCIFCTNVEIKGIEDHPGGVVEYNGMDSLCNLENGYNGVLYLIDEIHLEFNSLESKNISIEEMTEFAQQRKQRKHIVGTSQVFMRMAKPLREQIHDVVMCRKIFSWWQQNTLIDGTSAYEEGGQLIAESKGVYNWFHSPELYGCYDTYAKMHRYRKEWSARETNSGRYVRYSGNDNNGSFRGRKF